VFGGNRKKKKKKVRRPLSSGKPDALPGRPEQGEGNADGRGSAEKPRGRLPAASHGNYEGQDRGSDDLPELAPRMIKPLVVPLVRSGNKPVLHLNGCRQQASNSRKEQTSGVAGKKAGLGVNT
jgi:hypothetical protein